MEGGFDSSGPKFETITDTELVVIPGWERVSLQSPDLPEMINMSVSGIMAAEGATKQDELAQWVQEYKVSK